jgi:hypothetical protein
MFQSNYRMHDRTNGLFFISSLFDPDCTHFLIVWHEFIAGEQGWFITWLKFIMWLLHDFMMMGERWWMNDLDLLHDEIFMIDE